MDGRRIDAIYRNMENRNMRRSKVSKLIKKIICIICVIAIYMTNSQRIYAMETLKGQIEERIESANAREYEMNIVLNDLFRKHWNERPYSLDEIEQNNPVDEPLGQYSEERLKEYTDEDFRVEFEYCCGYYGVGIDREKNSENPPHLIQIERIYKDGKLYIYRYNVWFGYAVNDVIFGGGFYVTDEDDYEIRKEIWEEKYYESVE